MTISATTKNAVAVLEALVAGKDPKTGERLPADHFANELNINAGLWVALGCVDDYALRCERRAAAVNAGEPWCHEDDRTAVGLRADGYSIRDIAHELKRTEAGVRARLKVIRDLNKPTSK